MEKIRREVLENQLKRIAALLGKPSGNPWQRVGDKNVSTIGTLSIDHNSVYGGYNVEEIVNEHGAIRHPFGDGRLKGPAFWAMLNGIERALELVKSKDTASCR